MTDPYGRTPQGFFERIMQRLEALETRLGRILPGRLGPQGVEITDWDDATAVGFYWGRPSIPNSPEMSTSSFSGVVYYDGNPTPTRLMQEAWVITDPVSGRGSLTWRRVHVNGAWTAWALDDPRALRSGARLGPQGQYTPDWNAVFAPGWYWSDGDTLNNPPEPGTWFYGGPQYHEGGDRATQFVYDVGGVYPTAPGLGWARYFDGTSWGAWRRLMSPHINENRSNGRAYLDTADAPGGPASTYIALSPPADGASTNALSLSFNGTSIFGVAKGSAPITMNDTGWLTSGVGFAAATDFTLNSYRVRQFGDGHVVGLISLTYTGATLTPDAMGNIPDKVMFTLPSGWQNVNTDGTGWPALGHRAGYYSLFLRVLAGEYRIANISPGATIVSGHVLHVKIDHYTS